MQSSTKQKVIVAAVMLGALAIWVRSRKEKTPAQVIEEIAPGNSSFYAPYYQTNPGIEDTTTTGGGPAFVGSNINVSVSNPALSMLTQQYFPMFGYVGVTAVGA